MMPIHLRPHDLLRVLTARAYFDFVDDAEVAFKYIRRDALVVVRRAADLNASIAVGIRGDTRSERYAATMSCEAILEVISPVGLLHVATSHKCAAFDSLATLKERWPNLSNTWGPTGSVAFELASGRPTVNDKSDLDILMNIDLPITKDEASRLLQDTRDLPCKVDVQVETAVGGFALEEYASGTGKVLMRTCAGVKLTRDPWDLREGA